MSRAEVVLWGRHIASVALDDEVAVFQYHPDFAASGIQVSPLRMPLGRAPLSFPALPRPAFHGLPGLLADSLPDRYGNALIDAWLARQGRSAASFDAVERLCYTGARGMGALEFLPASGPEPTTSEQLELAELHALAGDVLSDRLALTADLGARSTAMRHLLQVGTSAGGARAKALVAWNEKTNEVRSGQVEAGDGFASWLLKFDGVRNNRDKELEDPRGFGALEYAYHLMAVAAGLEMAECRLMEEGSRRHFMTRRFDRTVQGRKLHMQSLAALAHMDFNAAGANSYEQALRLVRELDLGMASVEQLFRRMVFNIVARNQDDHVKNIAFLMTPEGSWSLAPAYDVTYSYNPQGDWTSRHQMTLNGKRDAFELADFRACARAVSMKRGRARRIVEEVTDAVGSWLEIADVVGIPEAWAAEVRAHQRLELR
ncbi:MAG TPA: type II toxin-antitoxin system HipA family toxin [Myxococcota bacterium]|nr:type II toxin-antitoxin system HipA family toxin [Myxococcota bacterium]